MSSNYTSRYTGSSSSSYRYGKRQEVEIKYNPDEDSDADEDYTALAGEINKYNFDYSKRSKYIPLRLTPEERTSLALVESALDVSEYTDKIDIYHSYGKKNRVIDDQLNDICSILTGLLVAANYRTGSVQIAQSEMKVHEEFFQTVFEVARRYKIMNPDKMRTQYGKLIYMLQDAEQPEIKRALGFSFLKDIRTVETFLTEKNGMVLLDDQQIYIAVGAIKIQEKSREEVLEAIQEKERAVDYLKKTYATEEITEDDIELVLRSLGDNNAFLCANSITVSKMISYLKKHFDPINYTEETNLQIRIGKGGSRLSHSHSDQYNYVLQSMTLWEEIMKDMFQFWFLAEKDLVCGGGYKLADTGQGLNRLQSAPLVGGRMSKALNITMKYCEGRWVGSGVVHLGDRCVPNALMFIDKYSQVPRIVNPLVRVVEELELIEQDPNLLEYLDEQWGGKEALIVSILQDFFRHGFDGSGADNYYDAGSCIDGRLTSAWNWCSLLDKKPWSCVFYLAGFIGFDGDWQR